MAVDASNIHGRDPSGNTRDVNVDASGNLVLSTSGGTLAASTAAVIATVSASSTPGLLQASNTARKGLIAYSCTGSAAPALIAYTTGVSSTNFSLSLAPGAYWEMPVPLNNGGISVAVSTTLVLGTATLLVTELS